MSAQIIRFPSRTVRASGVESQDPGTLLVEALRQKILKAGGTWDPEKSEHRIRRLISLLADAKPIK